LLQNKNENVQSFSWRKAKKLTQQV